MEDIGSEVSEKIRAAIKAKLVELGVFIDNELPDYVMIMVANKRTRQQMNEDLQLFLGRNTKTFTSWLITVMQRLQEVTVADFDPKKEGKKSKGEKRKRSNSEESAKKESKSPDEQNKTGKKHLKKVKGGKKMKKSKYKAKEKEKDKDSEGIQESTESTGNDDKEDKGPESSHVEEADSPSDNSKDKVTGKDEQNLSDSSVPKVPEKVKDSYSENEEATSARSSSSSHYSNGNVKDTVEDEPEEEEEEEEDEDLTMEGEKDEEMEDEFNIEPLKETDDQSGDEKSDDKPNSSKSESQSKRTETAFKVPTRELLRQHNRMFREMEGNYGKRRKKSDPKPEPKPDSKPDSKTDSKTDAKTNDIFGEIAMYEEARMSSFRWPRRDLRKIVVAGETLTLPPDFNIFDLGSKNKAGAMLAALRARKIREQRNLDMEEDENDTSSRVSPFQGSYSVDENTESAVPSTSEPKSNIISISKSLEMEKNLGVKSDECKKKSENKVMRALILTDSGCVTDDKIIYFFIFPIPTTSGAKKKSVSSRICTIPEPEEPEISSVIKVKPREFMPKEKQANKALLLKAVADAEKSIATAQARKDRDSEAKSSGVLLKHSIGKRFEKLAVTLSNLQAGGSISDQVKSKKVVSDSENTNPQDRKTESVKDSEASQGVRSIPKNISNKSEDQFISSKTSAMEKNDKYIHCWLEGVEKAVKDDEIVNPGDMDNYPVSYSGEEKDDYIPSTSSEEYEEEEDVEEEDVEEVDEEEEVEEVEAEELEEAEDAEETEEVEDLEEAEELEEDAQSAQLLDEEEESYEEQSEERISASTKGNEDECPEIVVTLDGLTTKTVKHVTLRKRDTPNGSVLSKKTDAKDDDLNDEETEERRSVRHKEVDSPNEAGNSKQSGSGCADKGSKFEKISDRFGRINKASLNHEYKEKYYQFERERYEKKRQKYQGTDKEKYYEEMRDKYSSPGESKNKKLIARLSEKFGKVDREFDDKKKKYSEAHPRSFYYKQEDKGTGKDAKYSKRDRNSKNQSKP